MEPPAPLHSFICKGHILSFAFAHAHRSLNAAALAGITLVSACGGASAPTTELATLDGAAAHASEQIERGRRDKTPENMPTPNITSVSDISVTEGKKAVFTVTLSGPAPVGATVRLSLTSKGATVGNDYSTRLEYSNDTGTTYTPVESGGTAVVAPGATSFLVRVTTLNDAAAEATEQYNFYVTPVGNIGSVQGYGIGTILDAAVAAVPAPVAPAPAPAPAPVTDGPAPKPIPIPVPAPPPVTIVAVTPAPAPTSGGIPTPATIVGKPKVGQIVARSGQVIENVHVTTTSGSCIIVNGVSNVIIRNSEIGPCGQPGDRDTQGVVISNASHITIQRNVIHDVSSGVYAATSRHPIIMERNYVYNVRGPAPRGQMIQMNNVKGGTAGSKVNCNVSDAAPGTRYGVVHNNVTDGIEDHINMFQSPGLAGDRTEIAYNRLRGGHKFSVSGSGFVLGDVGGGYVNAHHNTIVNVANVGAGIAGGNDISIDDNRIYQHRDQAPYVNLGLMVWGQAGASCTGGHTVRRNRVWTLNTLGAQASYWNAGNCSAVAEDANTFADSSLSPAIFDEVPAACN